MVFKTSFPVDNLLSQHVYQIGGLLPFIMHCFSVDYISDSFHYAAIAKVTQHVSDSFWDNIFLNGHRWNKRFDMCFKTKTHFQRNLFSFVFKMALSKVDLNKQIIMLQNIWISTCNIFNSVISFLTERHKRQREIILKMLIADSNKMRNTKKKE